MRVLQPQAAISPEQLQAGQRELVRDLAWASLEGALSGGVILAAFALALGATPFQMGVLAAIPFLSQAAQLPATLVIEHLRKRRLVGVLSILAARTLILSMALLPLLADAPAALAALMAVQVMISIFHAMGACAVNSWLHQLIPHEQLGSFFSRRLFAGTVVSCIGTLAAGALVDRGPFEEPMHAWVAAFVLAGIAGYISCWHLGRAPEPLMPPRRPQATIATQLRAPLHDGNFRRLLLFLGAWTVASNLAAPFITVYLIRQLGYPVSTVTQLWVASQLANALTLYLWGRVSDRLSNKGVLAVVLPLNFAGVLALVLVRSVPDPHWQLGLLYAVHVLLGVATGGIGLATGNLGLKLAPHGQGTAYLATIGLVCAVAGGMAPLVAGVLAETFQAWQLSAVVRWSTPGSVGERAVVSLAHWEFLFAISALAGLYVLHALSRIREGDEVSERQVAQAFALETWRTLNNLSSIGGALGNLFPFERLAERRRWWRERRARQPRPVD